MIKVQFVHESDEDGVGLLAELRITRVDNPHEDDFYGSYAVELGVLRGGNEVGIYSRALRNWPRQGLNVLALVNECMHLFDDNDEVWQLENGHLSPDMAREQRGAMWALQAGGASS